jgi:hypothetical protein
MPHVPYTPRPTKTRNIKQSPTVPRIQPSGPSVSRSNIATPMLNIGSYKGPSRERLMELLRLGE